MRRSYESPTNSTGDSTMMTRKAGIRLLAIALLCGAAALPAFSAGVTATAGDVTLTDQGLVAFGRIAANTRDSFGETFGSGSALAIDAAGWTKNADGSYSGSAWMLPDRGYNVEGTTDYRERLNTVALTLKPVAADGTDPSQASLTATLKSTMLFTDDKGVDTSGLDPIDGVRAASGTLPALPQAANGKLALDAEGLVHMADGTLFVSDEYGPNIYRFGADGKLLGVTTPPAAFTPIRKGVPNYSANAPTEGAAKPDPENPETGRQNNQGLEGLSMTSDGKYLIAVLQSANRQDGGDKSATRDKTRALVYDLSDPANLKLVHEYVVPLPTFKSAEGKTLVAAQSEIVAISDTAFLMLVRDSGNGQGVKGDTSLYRQVVLVDAAKATDIANGPFDAADHPVAPGGVLDASVTAATVTPFIDLNDNAELGRFGMHNGAPNDRTNLSEKWEGMSLASVADPAAPDDYFLFIVNDNDFLTQDGYQVGAAYKAEGGADVDTMIEVRRVTIKGLN